MMKRLVAILFFSGLVFLAFALVAPGFINWNKHKSLIISQLEPYIQRKIEVAGDVRFQILPNPQLLLEQVSVENLLKLKTLEAKVKLRPLFEGKFEVETINLVEPEVTLEVGEDGKANWREILTERAAAPVVPGFSAATAVHLNQVTMSQGKLAYINRETGAEWRIDRLNLRIAADTLLGPYRITGDMLYDGKQVNVEVGTGKYDNTRPVPVKMSFLPVEGLPQVNFNGVVGLKPAFSMQGDISVEQGTLTSLFKDKLLRDVYFLNETADLRANLDFTGQEAKLTNIKAKFSKNGSLSGNMTMHMAAGQKPFVNAELEGSNLKVFGRPGILPASESADFHLRLKGRNITWNTLVIPNLAMTVDGNEKEWSIRTLTVTMPGQSVFSFSGIAIPKENKASATVKLSAEDISKAIPGLPYAKMTFDGSIDIRPEKISLHNFKASSGEKEQVSGSLVIDRKAEKFTADLSLAGEMPGADGLRFQGSVVEKAVSGEMTAEVFDFGAWNRQEDVKLAIQAKKALWRENEILDAMFHMEGSAEKTVISDLKGKMWGGDLMAGAERQGKSGMLKGSLRQADLDILRKLMELEGFSLGKGDIEFDLKDDGSSEEMFRSLSGKGKIRTETLKLEAFRLSGLKKLFFGMKTPPGNLLDLLKRTLRQGNSTYKDVEAVFKIEARKIGFSELKLANEEADITASGEFALGPEEYSVTAEVTPKAEFPAFTLSLPGYAVDAAPFRDYIIRKNPVTVAPVREPVPVIERTIQPPNPIGGILERLEETPAPAEAPHAAEETLPEEIPPSDEEIMIDEEILPEEEIFPDESLPP